MRSGACRVWGVLVALGGLAIAHADMRQCSEHRVEYLVGGVGRNGSGGRNCSAAPASTLASLAAPGPTGTNAGSSSGRMLTPDDGDRRDILQQELDKARAALSELDKNHVPIPGAGTLSEQRARRVSDVSALEAELRRLGR